MAFGLLGLLFGGLVIDHGAEMFSAVAHLRRRSLRVHVGDQVATGQHLAECGNSDNGSEPHVPFQLMDRRAS
jgi:murein DD-endopeptidase MepM/ murein hydrolase activator NlpD